MSKTEPFVFKAHVTVTDEQAHGCIAAPLNVLCTFGGWSVIKTQEKSWKLKTDTTNENGEDRLMDHVLELNIHVGIKHKKI